MLFCTSIPNFIKIGALLILYSYNFRGGLTTPRGLKCGNPYTYVLYNVIKYSNTKFHQNRCISNFLMFNIWRGGTTPRGRGCGNPETRVHLNVNKYSNTKFHRNRCIFNFFSIQTSKGGEEVKGGDFFWAAHLQVLRKPD